MAYGGKTNGVGMNAGRHFAGRRVSSGIVKASGGKPKCGGLTSENYSHKKHSGLAGGTGKRRGY